MTPLLQAWSGWTGRLKAGASLRRLARQQDGTASVEFVLAVPLLMAIFMATFEAGMFMTQQVMLERAVDVTMRDLRLGKLNVKTAPELRTEICKHTVVLANCSTTMLIEMRKIDLAAWALPTDPTTCINREEPVDPVVTFVLGQANEAMIVRVCVRVQPMFPGTGMGLALEKDGQGGFAMITASAYANEP